MNNYDAIMAAIALKLAAVAPARLVSRSFRNFDRIPNDELQAGVFTVTFGGLRRYPTDVSDGEGPDATALPVFAFRVVGQGLLAEDATGVAIEQAEFAMLSEIETLANELASDDTLDEHEELFRVVPQGAEVSEQLDAPFYWVSALFVAEIM